MKKTAFQRIIIRIKNRLSIYDQNYIGIFCGGVGTGKSESAVSLAMGIDPRFNINKNVVFDYDGFHAFIHGDDGYKGAALIWDEMGTGLDSRRFMSKQNIAITHDLETFRYKNLALICTLPGLGMMDTRAKQLSQQYFETMKGGIDRKRNVCRVKVYDMQYNSRMDKIYFRRPHVRVNDYSCNISSLLFQKPPDDVSREYKRISMDYKLAHSKELKEGDEVKDIIEKENVAENIAKQLWPIREDFKTRQGNIDKPMVSAKYNVGDRIAERIQGFIRLWEKNPPTQ